MGAREMGIRVSALVDNKPGELARLTEAVASAKGNFVAFGMFTGEDSMTKLVTFKVAGMTREQVRVAITPVVKELVDMR